MASIVYDIAFKADTKELQAALSTIQKDIANVGKDNGMANQMKVATAEAKKFAEELKKATSGKDREADFLSISSKSIKDINEATKAA
jgi:hypothetical protein